VESVEKAEENQRRELGRLNLRLEWDFKVGMVSGEGKYEMT